jgi:hypothetical protein
MAALLREQVVLALDLFCPRPRRHQPTRDQFAMGPRAPISCTRTMIVVRRLGLGIMLALATPAAIAQPRITAAELRAASSSAGLADNSAFTPSAHATAARGPLFGTLRLGESPMRSTPTRIAPAPVLGRDPQLFPAAEIAFFTDEGDLVPFRIM